MRKGLLAGSLLAGLIFTGSAGIAAADAVNPQITSGSAHDSASAPQNAGRPPVGNERAVPPGSPGDEDGDGILDTTVQPDNPNTSSASTARPPVGNEQAVPPGSPGDEDGDGILDTTVQPDNPDTTSGSAHDSASAPQAARPPVGNEQAVPPGSPGDEDGDGILDTTVQPDNPDA